MAGEAVPGVKVPTPLIVGGNDPRVIELNQQTFSKLRCTKHMEVIPGATYLFEEPGALEEVAKHAGAWFEQFLSPEE